MTQSNSDIILYGGPGAGKGTQAKILADKLQAVHLEMGQRVRQFAESDAPLASEVKSAMEQGELIPTSVTKAIVEEFVGQASKDKRIIFDGYPRSIEQVANLDGILRANGREAKMIYIELPDEVALDRLTNRATIEHRKDDLDKEVVHNRLEVFHKEANPLVEHYKDQNSFFEVDGDQSREAVAQDIAKAIE